MNEKYVMEVGEDNFEQEVIKANVPVVVDFFATWCGPCKMMAPVLDAFAEEFAGKLKFAKVDVDKSGELAMQFQITGVPTLVLFKNGEPVDSVVGMVPPGTLKARLEKLANVAAAQK